MNDWIAAFADLLYLGFPEILLGKNGKEIITCHY
jgi:hypothetical protein